MTDEEVLVPWVYFDGVVLRVTEGHESRLAEMHDICIYFYASERDMED